MHSDPKFGWRGEGVTYIGARKKRFQNAIPACILLRKNFKNDIPSQKYPRMALLCTSFPEYKISYRTFW
jgi:hypothetical protein